MKLSDISCYIGKPFYIILNKKVEEVIVKDVLCAPIDEECFSPVVHVKVETVSNSPRSIEVLAEDLYATEDEAKCRLNKLLIGCGLKNKVDALFYISMAINAISNYGTPDCRAAIEQLELALAKVNSIKSLSNKS